MLTPGQTEDVEITAGESIVILGLVDRSSMSQLVRRGRLVPSRKLPGITGTRLFWKSDIIRLRDQRLADLQAQIARISEATPA